MQDKDKSLNRYPTISKKTFLDFCIENNILPRIDYLMEREGEELLVIIVGWKGIYYSVKKKSFVDVVFKTEGRMELMKTPKRQPPNSFIKWMKGRKAWSEFSSEQ